MLHGGQVPCPHSLIRLATSDASQAAVPGTSYVCHCSTSSNLHSGTSRNTPEAFGAAIVGLRRAPLRTNYGSDSPGLRRKARHLQAVLPLPLEPGNGCCNTHAHSGTEAWCAAPRWFVLTHTPTCSGVRVMAAAIKSSGWRSKLHANCWADHQASSSSRTTATHGTKHGLPAVQRDGDGSRALSFARRCGTHWCCGRFPFSDWCSR